MERFSSVQGLRKYSCGRGDMVARAPPTGQKIAGSFVIFLGLRIRENAHQTQANSHLQKTPTFSS